MLVILSEAKDLSGFALAATVLVLRFPPPCRAQSSGIRTYCNPIDIDYKYNFEQLNEEISYRSGADPVIVNHKGSTISSLPPPVATGTRRTSFTGVS